MNYLKPVELIEEDSGMEMIDCIYVINLDKRPEKWHRVEKICKKQGLKVNRVSAVNGWELSATALSDLEGPYGPTLKPGEIGCILSHLSIAKDAYERGFNLIWVMEDDIEFLGDTHEISKLVNNLYEIDPEWDLLYTDPDMRISECSYTNAFLLSIMDLGLRIDLYPHLNRPGQDEGTYYQCREKKNSDIARIYRRFGTHSMLISRRGLEKILDYFSQYFLYAPIDWDLHYIPSFREYAAQKNIVTNTLTNIITDCRITNIK
jgi:GR25 family glycosyltransferase involved in LPS biosynthesis